MTMHSSKGLEFPIVYIMDANERVTPHHKAVLDADLEEERRMFYVAMTRAKDRLHVYYTKERYGKPQERSRFIDEYLYPDSAPPGEFRPGPEVKTKGMLESCRATSQQKTAAKTERPAMQQSAGTKPVWNGKVVR